jgi:hypothetical protein
MGVIEVDRSAGARTEQLRFDFGVCDLSCAIQKTDDDPSSEPTADVRLWLDDDAAVLEVVNRSSWYKPLHGDLGGSTIGQRRCVQTR